MHGSVAGSGLIGETSPPELVNGGVEADLPSPGKIGNSALAVRPHQLTVHHTSPYRWHIYGPHIQTD